MKKILVAALACIIPFGAANAGNGTVNYNSSGSSPFATTTDGSGNNLGRQTIWDYSAAANGAGVDSSHGLLVDPGSAALWGVGATGSAVPANANYIGIISGGNLVGWTGAVTQGTAANLNATVVGTGTFATQSAITAASGSIASGAVSSGAIASGAFASGAVASGAISSGAVASGAIASGALAVGAGADGWNVTMGTKADAAWSSGSGTEISLLKTIATNTGASVPAGSAIVGKFGIDQTTFGTTNGVVNAANTYNTVAASQTTQALTGGGGGATGDYLSHCLVIPTTTSPGVMTILDNATTIVAFPGGASSLSNLAPFALPVGAKSVSGAWKITTGAGLSVACVGKFT